jgi:hypothetical protein
MRISGTISQLKELGFYKYSIKLLKNNIDELPRSRADEVSKQN